MIEQDRGKWIFPKEKNTTFSLNYQREKSLANILLLMGTKLSTTIYYLKSGEI